MSCALLLVRRREVERQPRSASPALTRQDAVQDWPNVPRAAQHSDQQQRGQASRASAQRGVDRDARREAHAPIKALRAAGVEAVPAQPQDESPKRLVCGAASGHLHHITLCGEAPQPRPRHPCAHERSGAASYVHDACTAWSGKQAGEAPSSPEPSPAAAGARRLGTQRRSPCPPDTPLPEKSIRPTVPANVSARVSVAQLVRVGESQPVGDHTWGVGGWGVGGRGG